VNCALAERLGLEEPAPLLPVPHAGQVKLTVFVPESHLAAVREAVCGAGAGVIGEYTHCSFNSPGTGTFLPGENTSPYSGEKHVVNEEPERRFETLTPKSALPRVLDALRRAHPYEEPAYDVYPLEGTDPSASLGRWGKTAEPMTLQQFAIHAAQRLEAPATRFSGPPDKRIETVAVIGGSGGSQAALLPPWVDALVTGDVDYHDAMAATEKGTAVVDAGHAETEKWVVPSLVGHLRARLEGLEVLACGETPVFRSAGP
jgi:hypothetical protein